MDFSADVKTYRQRANAIAEYATFPEREAEVARMKIASAPATLAAKPIAECATVGELFDSLEDYRMSRSPGVVSQAKLDIHQAETGLRSERQNAILTITETSDPAIAADANQLRRNIAELRRDIAQRADLIRLESDIAELTSEIEAFNRGIRPSTLMYDSRDNRTLYRAMRERRAALVESRPAAEKAKLDNARDEAEIARLGGEVEKIEAKRFVLDCMKWSKPF